MSQEIKPQQHGMYVLKTKESGKIQKAKFTHASENSVSFFFFTGNGQQAEANELRAPHDYTTEDFNSKYEIIDKIPFTIGLALGNGTYL